MQPMTAQDTTNDDLSNQVYLGKKDTFLMELRATYKRIYNSVCPIPFLTERKLALGDIYVDGGIELENQSSKLTGKNIWLQLNNCNDILNHPRLSSFLSIIEGDPGIGKSTLALKFACDWCEINLTSPLKDVEILIYLRLRQIGNIKSIYTMIKLLLLPIDSTLSEKDIETIFRESSSVILILDGYDEYNCPQIETDIQNILGRNMFQKYRILLTTRIRVFPENLPPETDIIRLTGFNEDSRMAYIQRVVGGDNEAADEIRQSLHNNPILGDLCQVPLFFTMYAHIAHEFKAKMNFTSVTSYFSYIISCFHSHLRNKPSDTDNNNYKQFENDYTRLSRVAFDALTATNPKLGWIKDELCPEIGHEFYTHYVKVGILVEEEELCLDDEPGVLEPMYKKTHVRFFHKLFCEWYAAYFLSSYAQNVSMTELRNTLKSVNPYNLQYVYRFACGLNKHSADSLIKYLQSLKSGDKFAILCLLEQTRDAEEITDTAKDLCAGTVLISKDSSSLTQRSTLQLIEIASKVKIPVKSFHLENCFNCVDLQTHSLILTNGLHVYKLSYVKELKITEMGREITLAETINILKFSLFCERLEQLTLECTLLPVALDDGFLIEQLKSKQIKIFWIPTATWYCLTTSGQWETRYGSKALTTEAYQDEVDNFREEWSCIAELSV